MQHPPKRSPRHHIRTTTEIKSRQGAAAGLRQRVAVRRPREAQAAVRRDETQQAASDSELAVVPQARGPGEEDHEVVDCSSAEEGHAEEGRLARIASEGRAAQDPTEDGWQEGEERPCRRRRRRSHHHHRAGDSNN